MLAFTLVFIRTPLPGNLKAFWLPAGDHSHIQHRLKLDLLSYLSGTNAHTLRSDRLFLCLAHGTLAMTCSDSTEARKVLRNLEHIDRTSDPQISFTP